MFKHQGLQRIDLSGGTRSNNWRRSAVARHAKGHAGDNGGQQNHDPGNLSAAELARLAKVLRRCASALDTLTTATDIAQGRGLANELDLSPSERADYVGRLLDIADDEAAKFEW